MYTNKFKTSLPCETFTDDLADKDSENLQAKSSTKHINKGYKTHAK